jgi:hypothetical protein
MPDDPRRITELRKVLREMSDSDIQLVRLRLIPDVLRERAPKGKLSAFVYEKDLEPDAKIIHGNRVIGEG